MAVHEDYGALEADLQTKVGLFRFWHGY